MDSAEKFHTAAKAMVSCIEAYGALGCTVQGLNDLLVAASPDKVAMCTEGQESGAIVLLGGPLELRAFSEVVMLGRLTWGFYLPTAARNQVLDSMLRRYGE